MALWRPGTSIGLVGQPAGMAWHGGSCAKMHRTGGWASPGMGRLGAVGPVYVHRWPDGILLAFWYRMDHFYHF